MSESHQLSTEGVLTDLGRRATRGGAITVIAQGLVFVINLLQIAILARLLTPDDFGVVAMVAVVIGFVSFFRDAGLSMATIQRATVSDQEVSSLFWINVCFGLIGAMFVALCAPVVAWFYDRPELAAITVALAGTFLFSGLMVQHQSLLKRQMRFGRLASIQVTAKLIGAGVALTFALYGAGYWALVYYQYAFVLASLLLVFILCPWRPRGFRLNRQVWHMLRFGGNVTGGNIANYLGANGSRLIVGKSLGGATLGIFDNAWQLLLLPLGQINAPITSVAFPTLSRLQDDPARFRDYYMKAAAGVICLSVPLITVMLGLSDWLIIGYLGPQWTEAIPIFQILGIYAVFVPIGNTTGWLFLSQGRTGEQFRWQVFSSVFRVFAALLGIQWGLAGMTWAFSVTGALLIPFLFLYVGRTGPVRSKDLGTLGMLALSTALAGIATVAAIRYFLNPVLSQATCSLVCIAGIGLVDLLVFSRFDYSRFFILRLTRLARESARAFMSSQGMRWNTALSAAVKD